MNYPSIPLVLSSHLSAQRLLCSKVKNISLDFFFIQQQLVIQLSKSFPHPFAFEKQSALPLFTAHTHWHTVYTYGITCTFILQNQPETETLLKLCFRWSHRIFKILSLAYSSREAKIFLSHMTWELFQSRVGQWCGLCLKGLWVVSASWTDSDDYKYISLDPLFGCDSPFGCSPCSVCWIFAVLMCKIWPRFKIYFIVCVAYKMCWLQWRHNVMCIITVLWRRDTSYNTFLPFCIPRLFAEWL